MSEISAQRMSKILADRIQERIIVEGMGEGTALPTEPEFMKEYGVSRTVVREAAALLVSSGLVEVRPRRGMTVRAADGHGLSDALIAQLRMNQVSLPQLLEVRLTLECSIARVAATKRTEADLCKLQENLLQMKKPDVNLDQIIVLDMEFHSLLAAATHNPFFQIVTGPINFLLRQLYIDKVGYMSLNEHTWKEHNKIFKTIQNSDAEAAEKATREHLERVGNTVETLFAGLPVAKQ